MTIEPTPRDVVFQDGTAKLYRFRRPADAVSIDRHPILLVPSLINRWYVLDLREGSSVVEALCAAGFDVFCLDWGEPHDEDRFVEWDDLIDRIARMSRRVLRTAGAEKLGLLGYCIGGTLTSIFTAIHPQQVAALVNLAGPIDFQHAGELGRFVDKRWFDPAAITSAGNISAGQMQAGFVALRPTGQLAKWVTFFDRLTEPDRLEAFRALDKWASDNIAFPASAYVRYIKELYQDNQLVSRSHAIRGRRVDLADITCPLLTVVTERDNICPPKAALALAQHSSSKETSTLTIPGGHVGAVVGAKAKTVLYPKLVDWFGQHLTRTPPTEAEMAQRSVANGT